MDMNLLEEILFAIQAAEKLIPALVSFANTVHPPTTDAPTKAVTVLNATQNALQIAGVTASTITAILPTLQAASTAAVSAPAAVPIAAVQVQGPN